MGIGFLEDRHDEITDLDLVLLRILRVVHGVLDDTMKCQRLHRFDHVVPGHALEIFIEEPLDLGAKSVDVGSRMAQDSGTVIRMNQRVEQMLDGQISMTSHDGFAMCRLEGQLQVAPDRTHSFSTPQRSGYPRSSAVLCTAADFVSATSRT